MFKKVIKKSDEFFDELLKLQKFESRYGNPPPQASHEINEKGKEISNYLQKIENPETAEELIESEIKRQIDISRLNLEKHISSGESSFENITRNCGIPKEDIDNLEEWLRQNKEKTLEVLENLYKTKNLDEVRIELPLDILHFKQEVEKRAEEEISKYQNAISEILKRISCIGQDVEEIEVYPTLRDRAYFKSNTSRGFLALPMSSSFYIDKKNNINLNKRRFIQLFGHELMGHSLQNIVSKKRGLPKFLSGIGGGASWAAAGTSESIANFFESRIFEDIKENPEVQKNLGIENEFDKIYKEVQDLSLKENYDKNFFLYGISLMASQDYGSNIKNSTLEKKAEILEEFSLDSNSHIEFINQYVDELDPEGNLNPDIVSELIYCVKPVQRALKEFEKEGITYNSKEREKIDSTFLTGFWTPQGFEDFARLRAKNRFTLEELKEKCRY